MDTLDAMDICEKDEFSDLMNWAGLVGGETKTPGTPDYTKTADAPGTTDPLGIIPLREPLSNFLITGINFSSLKESSERLQKRQECTDLLQSGVLSESRSAPDTMMEAEADGNTRTNNESVYNADIEALWRAPGITDL